MLRDADVLISGIHALVEGTATDKTGFAELHEALVRNREARRDEVRQMLSGSEWVKLQLYLTLWPRTLEEVDGLNEPMTKYARKVLAKAWKKPAIERSSASTTCNVPPITKGATSTCKPVAIAPGPIPLVRAFGQKATGGNDRRNPRSTSSSPDGRKAPSALHTGSWRMGRWRSGVAMAGKGYLPSPPTFATPLAFTHMTIGDYGLDVVLAKSG